MVEAAKLSCTEEETKEAKDYKKTFGKTIMITNQFVKMMEKALPCALRVLEQRKKDLATWGDKEREEFFHIMGVDVIHDEKIMVDHKFYRSDIEKRDRTAYSPIEVETTTVIEFMRKAVDRMHYIMSQLHVSAVPVEVSPVSSCGYESEVVPDKKVYKYGSFVNRTYTSQYSAFVDANETCICYPEEYKDCLEINIGYNFKGKALMGKNSQASTLCHEISHFFRVEHKNSSEEDKKKSRGPWGGVGTDDLPPGDHKQEKGKSGENVYIEYRDGLIKQHSLDVFKNAYNFELYFQLTDEEC
ncbi:hypothetical protein MXL54_21780 [Enterobacteriaceae bacterium G50]|nr:hypothetical protein [Enterobacteriaceae bacterium G50]